MKIDDVKLKTLSNLAQELRSTDREIQELEDKLKAAKQKYNHYSAVEIPQFMSELGLREFKLSDGTKFSVVPVLHLSVPKGTIDRVEEWLEDHNHSGLVKSNVVVPFGVGQEEYIQQIVSYLESQQVQYEIKKGIHHMTLDAWGREMENEGQVIPEDIFNVFRSNKTIIKE